MMETYEILTNRTSLYDHEAQADCRQTYERQILVCPRKVEAKFRHGAEVHNNAKWNPKKVGIGPSAPAAVLKYKYQHNRERWWGVRRQGIPAAYTR